MSTQQKNGNGLAGAKPNGNKTNAVATVKPEADPVQKPEEKKAEETKPDTKEAVVKPLHPVVPQVPAKVDPPYKHPADLPPVEDRVLKVNQLFAYVGKLETLQETLKKLKAFKLSSDGNRDTLRIQDSKGNEFTTSNSAVIADVIETLKQSIAVKIAEVDKQIRF